MAENPRIAAERALLGAVLLDPGAQGRVLEVVRAGDFLRPWHGQVLAAIGRARSSGEPAGLQEVCAELRRDPDLPAGVARDGVLVAELMEAAPKAGHASAYAGVVVENAIRQKLWIAGSRVRQVAASGDLPYALNQVAAARDEVRQSRERWSGLPEEWRPEVPSPSGSAARPARAWRPRGPEAEVAVTSTRPAGSLAGQAPT